MNEERFLASLERKLLWHFSGARTREVVADYRDYFEQGKAEGRADRELCEACGTPGEIVRSLLEEEKGRRVPPMIVFCLWCAVILCFTLLLPYAGTEAVWPMLLLPLTGVYFRREMPGAPVPPAVRRAYALGTLLSVMLLGMAIQGIAAAAGGGTVWGIPPEECGPRVSLLLTTARLMAVFFWIAGEMRLHRAWVQWPLSFLLAGITAAGVRLDVMLHTLDTLDSFFSHTFPDALSPLAAGLLLCIAAAFCQKRVDAWTAR